MSKVLIAVHTLTSVNQQVYSSHINLAFRMGREHTEDEFILFSGWRTSIDRFRNEAAKLALRHDCDYLLFIDDDVLLPRDTYTLLKEDIERYECDIVTPIVYIRSYPFRAMFFKTIVHGPEKLIGLTHFDDWQEFSANQQLTEDVDKHIIPCAAIGFSCCLMKVELLKNIQPAWFCTGTDHTEDVYFCVNAKQTYALRGLQVKIGVDTRIRAGHLLDPEFIAVDTRKELMQFHESLNPGLTKKYSPTAGDNTEDYNIINQAAVGKVEEYKL